MKAQSFKSVYETPESVIIEVAFESTLLQGSLGGSTEGFINGEEYGNE